MKNTELWKPSKFVPAGNGDWRPSDDPRELAPSSRHTSGRALQAYLSAIRAHARGHLLDLGCGKAPLYGAYVDHVTDVTCVDWPNSLHDTSHVDVYADLNEPLPLESSAYDTILSTSVLEHIWRHDVMWQEMSRVLRPGGRIILGTPFLYWLHEEPYDFFRWTPYALSRAASECGLTVLELYPFGDGRDVFLDLTMKLAAGRSPRLGRFVRFALSGVFGGGSRSPTAPARKTRFPLGHVIVAEKARPGGSD